MVKTGRLEIDHNSGISQLNSGPSDRRRLAKKEAEGDPFANATKFLVDDRGLDDGDFIFVTGENGTQSGVAVIFITDAQHAAEVITAANAATESLARADRAAAKQRRPTKKPGKKLSKGNKKNGKTAKKK